MTKTGFAPDPALVTVVRMSEAALLLLSWLLYTSLCYQVLLIMAFPFNNQAADQHPPANTWTFPPISHLERGDLVGYAPPRMISGQRPPLLQEYDRDMQHLSQHGHVPAPSSAEPIKKRPRRPVLPWAQHKEELRRLYLEENSTLDEIRDVMKVQRGFEAT